MAGRVAFPLVTIGIEWEYTGKRWIRYLLRKVPGTKIARREPLIHLDVDLPYCPCCLCQAFADHGVELCPQCGSQLDAHEGLPPGI